MSERARLVSVFCYGTLLFPEVMRAITGRDFASRAASASGWARYRVRGEVFPALVREAGARTAGAVFDGIDPHALAALDDFEGPLYLRCELEVACADGNRLAAQVWVLAPGREVELTREPWDPDAFARLDLRGYLAQIHASGSPYAPR